MRACVLWPLNVLCDLDLWCMDPSHGHCTSFQWGQHLYQVRWQSINAYISYSADTKCYGRTRCIPTLWRGIKKKQKSCIESNPLTMLFVTCYLQNLMWKAKRLFNQIQKTKREFKWKIQLVSQLLVPLTLISDSPCVIINNNYVDNCGIICLYWH